MYRAEGISADGTALNRLKFALDETLHGCELQCAWRGDQDLKDTGHDFSAIW
jgi:hypothetical protein